MLLLNSSIRGLSPYLLFLAAFLNFCTNSSIVLLSYSTFFNSTTFTNLLFPLPNSFFSLVRKSLTINNSNFPVSKFFKIFSFQIFADIFYIYNNIYCTCFSTDISLIFILMYDLYTVTKSATLLEFLSNVDDLAILALNLVLSFRAAAFSSYFVTNITIYACITAIYSSCCLSWSKIWSRALY